MDSPLEVYSLWASASGDRRALAASGDRGALALSWIFILDSDVVDRGYSAIFRSFVSLSPMKET